MSSSDPYVPIELEGELAELWNFYRKDWVSFGHDVLQVRYEPAQAEAITLLQNNERVEMRCCHGAGKSLSLDTPLPSADGWVMMGDVKLGDRLYDEMGSICRVSWVGPVERRKCYRITFDDGSEMVASAEHGWNVLSHRRAASVRAKYRCRKVRGSSLHVEGEVVDDWRRAWDYSEYKETKELAAKVVVDEKTHQANWLIPTCCAVAGDEVGLPVNPYTLGAWLGDVTSGTSSITIGHSDFEDMREFLQSDGERLRVQPGSVRDGCAMYNIASLVTGLKRLGVDKKKHVPKMYLRAPYGDRLQLLRGLMDTDGFCAKGRSVGFDVCNRQLRDDVAELACSFGWKAFLSEKDAKLDGRVTGRCHRLNFTPDVNVFRLKRKSVAWESSNPDGHRCRSTARFVRAVEEVPTVPTRCIMVDSPSHLFLAGRGFVPTHNTFVASCAVLTVMSLYPYATVFSTAPTTRQVEVLLWQEIGRRFWSSLLPDLGFSPPMTRSWKLFPGWAAFGAASDQSVNVEGFHSPTAILYVVDEAKGVRDEIYNSIEGGMNAPISRQFRITTPGAAHGEHYQCSEGNKRHLWKHVKISAWDVPRLHEWAAQCREEWGEDSPVYRMKVLAEYADEAMCKVFPEYILRLFEENMKVLDDSGERIMGVDVSRLGADKTVFAYRYGAVLKGQESFVGKRSYEVADLIINRAKRHHIDRIIIDSIGGYGTGVMDDLAKKGFEGRVEPFASNWGAFDPGTYFNRKAEVAFSLQKKIQGGLVGGVLNEDLRSDLMDYDYIITPKEQLRMIEPSGSEGSPDFGDAFLIAFSTDDQLGACVVRPKRDDPVSDEDLEVRREVLSFRPRVSLMDGAGHGRSSKPRFGRIFSRH